MSGVSLLGGATVTAMSSITSRPRNTWLGILDTEERDCGPALGDFSLQKKYLGREGDLLPHHGGR